LLEKEGAIAQAGKAIEDLRVSNIDLARSHREIERANTDLVGQNTALEEKIHGKLPYTFTLLFARYFLVLSNFHASVFAGLKDELLAA